MGCVFMFMCMYVGVWRRHVYGICGGMWWEYVWCGPMGICEVLVAWVVWVRECMGSMGSVYVGGMGAWVMWVYGWYGYCVCGCVLSVYGWWGFICFVGGWVCWWCGCM